MNQPNQSPINLKTLAIFMLVSIAIIVGWGYVQEWIWGPAPKRLTPVQQRDLRDHLGPLSALAPTGTGIGDLWRFAGQEIGRQMPAEARTKAVAEVVEAKKKEEEAKRALQPKVPVFKPDLVDLGHDKFNLQVRLTNKGGGVDRVIVTHFKQADQNGKPFREPDGKVRESLHLIPGTSDLTEEERQKTHSDELLPSFLIYHYANPDDQRPENLLGERAWKVESRPDESGRESDRQEAAFSLEVPELGVKITKTYALAKGEYHIGLSVKIEKLKGATPKPFRYQLSGGRNLAIEGIWYMGTFRNVMAGWVDPSGVAKRHLEDSASIQTNHGSERVVRGENVFQYAAVAGQYFASAVCIDDTQEKKNFVEFVRGTAEGAHPKEKPQLGDITPRLISETLTLGDAPVEHKYLLYHGPVKVRLLHQMRGDQAVAEPLVERYERTLNLRTMTDYHSDNFIGRFANFIWWTDLTIATTNIMHGLLGFLMSVLPVPGLAIIILTLLVRSALLPLSRKQTANMAKMQAKMKEIQPQLKKLEEDYKGRDGQEFQMAKLKMMKENGINPMAQMGGCLLLFAQMPIFMGLYYCLQENVFFRLKSFLWMPSLAAPDMLIHWGESIPFISDPNSLGSPLYLGPFFNLLPIIAVAVMIVQQKYMTPPAADEQQAMQMSMMKYMMIFMGIFFYKVASGLVLYFIISSLWGVAERKLLPKPKTGKEPPPDTGNGVKRKGKPDKPAPVKKGWLGQKWEEILRAAEKK